MKTEKQAQNMLAELKKASEKLRKESKNPMPHRYIMGMIEALEWIIK